jgi:dihydrofolate reductase
MVNVVYIACSLDGFIAKPDCNKTEIVSRDIRKIEKDLNGKGIKNIYIDGGRTTQSFLKEDLIDEMIITTTAKILGAGIPLFGSIGSEKVFKIEEVEQLNDFLGKTYYKRVGIN